MSVRLPWHRRRARIRETHRAIAKQDRLSEAIDYQIQEATAVNAKARERLERNHLTELFEGIIIGKA